MLIVEPSVTLLEIEGELLIRGGFYPCPATSISGALIQLAACTPHAILVAYTLPDGTGVDLIELAHERGAFPPIVGVTGREDARAALRAAGVELFLEKPFTAQELLDVVRAALARPRGVR